MSKYIIEVNDPEKEKWLKDFLLDNKIKYEATKEE